MSLDDLEEIYRLYDVPLEKRFSELRKALSRSRTQKPDADTKLDVGSLSTNTYSYLKVVNDHYNIKLHGLGTSEYYPASEPDFVNCRLIIQTDHFGRKLYDDSQIPATVGITNAVDPDIPRANVPRYPRGQDITCYGEPLLEDGFDRGYGDPTNTKKRQALHFNRPTSPTYLQDYIKVRDQASIDSWKSLRIQDNTRMSYLFRVKMDSFDSSGGIVTTLLHHCNDSSITNGLRIAIDNTNLRWTLKKGGVQYAVKAVHGITVGEDRELGFAWYDGGATDADKFQFYVDGTLKTTVTDSSIAQSGTDLDMFIGKRGDTDGGYVQGYIILVKAWRGTTHSATAFQRHFTNKLTTANIAYGKVATTEESVARNV